MKTYFVCLNQSAHTKMTMNQMEMLKQRRQTIWKRNQRRWKLQRRRAKANRRITMTTTSPEKTRSMMIRTVLKQVQLWQAMLEDERSVTEKRVQPKLVLVVRHFFIFVFVDWCSNRICFSLWKGDLDEDDSYDDDEEDIEDLDGGLTRSIVSDVFSSRRFRV